MSWNPQQRAEQSRRLLDRAVRHAPAPLTRPVLCLVARVGALWARPAHRALAALIEAALGESPEQARRIARSWSVHNARFRHRFLQLASGDGPAVDRAVAATAVPEGEAFRTFHQRDPRPLAFLTIHMGSYVTGLLALQRYGRDAVTCALRRKGWSQLEEDVFSHFARHGAGLHFLRHGEGSSLEAVRRLRSGDSLFAFYDLDHTYGETCPVTFLGRPMRVVRGPVELAIVGRALIVPFVVRERAARDVVEFETPVETALRPGESLDDATARITQHLARLAEHWIRESPDQWWHWRLVPDLATGPDQVDGIASARREGEAPAA